MVHLTNLFGWGHGFWKCLFAHNKNTLHLPFFTRPLINRWYAMREHCGPRFGAPPLRFQISSPSKIGQEKATNYFWNAFGNWTQKI